MMHISRRRFLRGSGGAMLALPIFDQLLNGNGDAFAADNAPLPKRFGVFFWGNGVRLDRWVPQQSGLGFGLSPALQPLSGLRDYINVPTGFDWVDGNRGHHGGAAGILSASNYIEQPHSTDSYSSRFRSPSIDWQLQEELFPNQPVRAVGISTAIIPMAAEGPTLTCSSHRNELTPILAENNPLNVFNAMFGNFDESGATDPRNALRTNVLDRVAADARRLQQRLGARDRQRLDAHLTAIGELQARIVALPPEFVGSCAEPSTPSSATVDHGDALLSMTSIMADLIALSFACDIDRAANVLFTGSVGYTVFPNFSRATGHHEMTHSGDAADQDQVHGATIYTMQCFAALLQRMRDTTEGAGNLLDNSLWMATSDLAEGQSHSNHDYPVVLAGLAGGTMRRGGVHVRRVNGNTNDIHMTILRAMGSARTSAGNEASDAGLVAPKPASTTAITELLA
jgi:hypothetical protein